MLKYLENLHNINKSFPDLSDYELFCDSALYYLIQNSTKLKLSVLNEIFISCLELFTDETLLSITYRLLSKIHEIKQENLKIPKKGILFKHLNECKQLKTYIYQFIILNDEKFQIEFFDTVKKDVWDKYSFSKGLCDIVSLETYKPIIDMFYLVEESDLLFKQLKLIVYTKILPKENLEYYLSKIGSNDGEICFLMYEVFNMIAESKIKTNILVINYSFCPLKGNSISIKFNENFLNVENVPNFIFYFFEFFEEKEELLNQIKCENYEFLRNYLKIYLKDIPKTIKIEKERIDKIRFSSRKNEKKLKPTILTEMNYDFDYMFSDTHYKVKMDCIEI